ncbi:hypothetical protein [Streptomyces mirabilis]|nr:hypothetical protein [Streptomyces mirabilis]
MLQHLDDLLPTPARTDPPPSRPPLLALLAAGAAGAALARLVRGRDGG